MSNLAKSLTPVDALRLEIHENWQLMIEQRESLEGLDQSLARVLLARAYQGVGQINEAQQTLNLLSAADRRRPEILCRIHLINARFLRAQGQASRALVQSYRAILIAKKIRDQDLRNEAQYSLALSQVESGKTFAALETFNKLSQMGLTNSRKQKVLLNKAWILWDLGQIEPLETLMLSLPRVFSLRFVLMIDILKARPLRSEAFLAEINSIYHQHPQEAFQTAMLFLEWHLIYSQDLSKEIFEMKFLRLVASDHSLFVSEAFAQLQKLESEVLAWCHQILNSLSGLHWRDRIERSFVALLLLARFDQIHVMSFYKKNIEDVLSEMNLDTPLMPRLNKLLHPQTVFERRLSTLLSGNLSNTLSETSGEIVLTLSNNQLLLNIENETRAMSLPRSPISVQLLKILAETQGVDLRKATLHQRLTGTRYVPALHDGRIYKLIQRLNKKLLPLLGQDLISFSGDNFLKLNFRLDGEK